MNVPREQIRCANIALGITAPILLAGAILLRDASEGVLQIFGFLVFAANFPILFALQARLERRKRRDQ